MPETANQPRIIRTLGAELVAVIVATIGPVLRLVADDPSPRELAVVVLIGSAGSIFIARTAEGRWRMRVAAAIVAGAGVGLFLGGWFGLWLAAGLLLADWLVRGRPPLPRLPRGEGAVRRVTHRLGSLVGGACFAVLSLPLLLLPWLLSRAAALDPLWSPFGWSRRRAVQSAAGASAGRPWATDSVRRPRALRVRQAAVAVGFLGLAGAGLAGVSIMGGEAPPPVPAAFEGVAWYPEYFEDMNWVMHSEVNEPLATVRIKDARTRHVNVVDGQRLTWSPPECGCRRLKVWVYGGSTTFGLGQRDDHTIPSELARAAWEDGYALDVENRGVGGDTHWEEAQRFAWDLAREEPPDMVVFYDGTNEVMASRFTEDYSDAPSVIPAEFWQEYRERFPAPPQSPPTGAVVEPRPEPQLASAAEVGREIARRYERSRAVSSTLARRADVVTAYVWQPTADLRDVATGEHEAAGVEWARERTAGARSALGTDVIDLADIYSDVEEPLFYDSIHTNELGARIVGRAIYDDLRPDVRQLAGAEGAAP